MRSCGSRAAVFPQILLLCAALIFCSFPARAQERAPKYSAADIQLGARIYHAQCISCHGENGDRVPGVNFRAGIFKRDVSDRDLKATITRGVPGTAMPPFNFSASELTAIVSYLRNMSTFGSRNLPLGDKGRGRALFYGAAKCSACHAVNGKGPRTAAPDLGDVGLRRTSKLIRRTLLDPEAAMLPSNRFIRAVTRGGKTITGRRLNEDTYTVQLIDEQGHLVSLDKADLREYIVLKTTSMPSYKGKLSKQELADLEAYLLSLDGVK